MDAVKQKTGSFGNQYLADEDLQGLILQFYKKNFWDKIHGDEIPDQMVAEELFDTAVNMGVGRAAEFLQKALNVLNRNGKSYNDIPVDRAIGRMTIAALHICLKTRGAELLYKVLNILQGAYYLEIMDKDPNQERFAGGWLSRVEIYKK